MKRTVIVDNNSFYLKKLKFDLDDLFTIKFYQWVDTQACNYYSGEVFDNVVYVNIIINVLAIEYFLQTNGVVKIIIKSADKKLASYILDACRRKSIIVSYDKGAVYKKKIWFIKLCMLLETQYLKFIQIISKRTYKQLNYNNHFSVVRSSAAKKKIFTETGIEILCEDKIAQGSFYNEFSKIDRIYQLRKAFQLAKRLLKRLSDVMNTWGFKNSLSIALDYAKFRFVPLMFYGLILDKLMEMPWKGKFISGNNLDMYALLEEEIAKKNGIKTICIPHGIEYGFKFPHCFTGDIFYTTSEFAAKYLNKLYSVNKFIYNQKIGRNMFVIKNVSLPEIRKVVYFSEPREPEVNVKILEELLNILESKNIKLFIKHHPKDNLNDYKRFNNRIFVINDLKEALVGNICISRKSTTLLEGVYNYGICAAIITNEKDNAIYHTFPSLRNENINQFYDVEKLGKWILKAINED